MPAWVVITASDLDDYLAAAAMTALRTAALRAGQTDPFARVMPDVAQAIRNAIASCARNQLSATANAVPPEFKSVACLMVIEAMQGRLPNVALTEHQGKMLEDGRRRLRDVADCKLLVTTPDDALPVSPVQASTGLSIVSQTPRLATRDSLSGL